MAQKKSAKVSEARELLDVAAPNLDTRLKQIQAGVSKITNRWELPHAVTIPGYQPQQYHKRVFSTGLVSADQKLKIGGFPRGHITEIAGPPSSGKSLLLYNTIREVQHQCMQCGGRLEYNFVLDKKGNQEFREVSLNIRGEATTLEVPDRASLCTNEKCKAQNSGGLAILFDQENSVDVPWLEQQRVELTKLLVLKLPNGEQVTDIIRTVMLQYKPDFIGIDSIAQLQPKTEQEKSMTDDAVMPGLHAKVMSHLCRHITAAFLEDPVNAPAIVWINQVRADVSGKGGEKVTGGWAPEHYSAIRVWMRGQQLVNQQKPELGRHGRITFKKCKVAGGVEYQGLPYILLPGIGFDTAVDTYETAKASGVFEKTAIQTGRHYWAEDAGKETELARSADGLKDLLRSDEDFAREVRKRILERSSIQAPLQDIYLGDAVPTTDTA